MSKKVVSITVFSIICVLILGACNKTNEVTTSTERADATDNKGSMVIAVMAPEFESSITNMFGVGYDIEVKSILPSVDDIANHWNDLDVVIDDFIKNNKDVDIVYGFPTEYLKGLVDKGNIKKLNGSLDESLLESVAPAVMEPFKKAGNGDVYAITPYFNNYVLAYNKNIFNELGIEAPPNGMTWEDTSNLAKLIQEKSNYKGVTLGMPSSDEQFYYLYLTLSRPIFKPESNSGEIQVNTELNSKYWTLFTDMYNDNEKATMEEFVQGKVAMGVFPISQLTDEKMLNFYGDYEPSDWGLVEMPIFEENEGGLAFTDSLFVVSKYSDNKQVIKFLEYIQGKEYAIKMAENSLFPTYWSNEIKEIYSKKYGFDFSPAYNQPGELIEQPKFNAAEFNGIQEAGEMYFVNVLTGTVNVQESLNDYQKEISQ